MQITYYGARLAKPPDVCVAMLAYNHSEYIKEAIESVFSQQTNFSIELIIGEDCSADKTREIIQNICLKSPISVKLITSDSNVGMHKNFHRILQASNSKYIAMLEGDDFWVSRRKLDIQISMLESTPEISLVAHQARRLFDKGLPIERIQAWKNEIIPEKICGNISSNQIIKFDFMIPTASVVFRRNMLDEFPSWVERLPMADWYLTLTASLHGRVYLIQEVMSVYRISVAGAMSTMSYEAMKKGHIDLLVNMCKEYADCAKKLLLPAVREHSWTLAYYFEINGQIKASVVVLSQLLRVESHWISFSPKTLSWYLRLRWPAIHRTLSRVFRLLSRHHLR